MRSSENGSDLGAVVLDQHQAGLGGTDLGDGGGDGARQIGAARDGGLRLRPSGRDRIDQIGVHQQRRMLEHPARDLRLVGREAEDHRRRRRFAERQRPRQRFAHQRRRIVEQHDQRAFGWRRGRRRRDRNRDRRAPARWLLRPARLQRPYGSTGGIDERSCLRPSTRCRSGRHGRVLHVRQRCLIKRSP